MIERRPPCRSRVGIRKVGPVTLRDAVIWREIKSTFHIIIANTSKIPKTNRGVRMTLSRRGNWGTLCQEKNTRIPARLAISTSILLSSLLVKEHRLSEILVA